MSIIKKSYGNPYLKILVFFQLFVADAPLKKQSPKKVSLSLMTLLLRVGKIARALDG